MDRLANGGSEEGRANGFHIMIHKRRGERSGTEQRRRLFFLVDFEIVERLQQISFFAFVTEDTQK